MIKPAALILAVTGALLVHLGPAAASSPISNEDARCRSYLYSGVTKLARGVIARLSKCHDRRLRGDLPPTTDCNDPANAVGTLHLSRYDDVLRKRAASHCEGEASSFSSLGYHSCPAPCEMAINSYGDFADCLICFTRANMSALSEEVLGTPAAPAEAGIRSCQSRIGRSLASYMSKILVLYRMW
jgi:hypothetical protein